MNLLDEFAARGLPEVKWVCRHSYAGRGLRLHQSRRADEHEGGGYDTPQQALEAFLERERDSEGGET